jgi:hypothetical protein
MAFTAYILLGDTLLGGAPCVVAIGMGHELLSCEGGLPPPKPATFAPTPGPRPSA